MKWTTQHLIAAGAMGALLALTALSEIPLNVITGVLGAGGVIGTFFELIVFVFAIMLIPRFGTGAIVAGIAAIILLPLPVFGPPGFLPKVAMLFGFGLLYDLLFFFFKRYGKWALALTTSALIILFDVAFYFVLLLFKVQTNLSLAAFLIFNAVFIVEGIAGSLVGWYVFQKLKNTAVVKRIQQ